MVHHVCQWSSSHVKQMQFDFAGVASHGGFCLWNDLGEGRVQMRVILRVNICGWDIIYMFRIYWQGMSWLALMRCRTMCFCGMLGGKTLWTNFILWTATFKLDFKFCHHGDGRMTMLCFPVVHRESSFHWHGMLHWCQWDKSF